MKKIKIEIEVPACELCLKEISKSFVPYRIQKSDLPELKDDEQYFFHHECVNKMLVAEAKKK